MAVNLSRNSLATILEGDVNSKPLLQVLDIKPVGSNLDRYRLLLWDAVSTGQAMIATQLNDRVKSGHVRKGSVVQLIDYICNTIQNRKAIRVYGYNGGARKSSQTPQWLKINCARQQGDTECGYYIMRYMLEIVTRSDPAKAIDEVFQDKMAYSQDEIDEVRDLWANYFLNA